MNEGPTPGEKRQKILQDLEDKRQLRRIEDLDRRFKSAISRVDSASRAGQASLDSQIKVVEAAETEAMKPPPASPPRPATFADAKGQAFVKEVPRKRAR